MLPKNSLKHVFSDKLFSSLSFCHWDVNKVIFSQLCDVRNCANSGLLCYKVSWTNDRFFNGFINALDWLFIIHFPIYWWKIVAFIAAADLFVLIISYAAWSFSRPYLRHSVCLSGTCSDFYFYFCFGL